MGARSVIALPLYLVGGCIWLLAAGVLFVADAISGDNCSNELLRL